MSKNWSSLYSNYALRGYCLVLWVLAAGVIFHFNSQSQSNDMGGEVNGSVWARIPGHEKSTRNPIFLPDITVYLKNVSTSALSPKVQTDLQGLYSIPLMPAGTYLLCYEAEGYLSDCSPEKLEIKNSTTYPAPVLIRPRPGFILGRVMQRDNRPGLYQDAAFGIEAQTSVTVRDAGHREVAKSVRANLNGMFLIPNVPAAQLTLRAVNESASVERSVSYAEIARAASTGEALQLVFQNSSPRIKAIFATSNGQVVRKASPGATVEITVVAEDDEKDLLHYMWSPSGASARFISSDTRVVKWTLPKSRGLHRMYILVKDGKGGYSSGRVELSTSGPQVIFSGRVRGVDASPVGDATVSVNDQSVKTGADGYFFIQLPKESPEYILNVNKEGYAFYSKVLSAEAVELPIRLLKAQKMAIEPGRTVVLKEKRNAGAGTEIRMTVNERRSRDLAPRLASLSISTIDPHDRESSLPGALKAVTESGRIARLVSYGTVDIQARDEAGNLYGLMPGQAATVKIPVDRARLAKGLPSTVGLWAYDATVGKWRREGTARLVGDAFEGTTRLFNVIRAGLAEPDVACMRVHADSSLVLPFNLRMTIPDDKGDVQVITQPITEAESLIFPLPPNEAIKLEVLNAAGKEIDLATQTINSGAAIPGAASTSPPPPPFSVCSSDAYLTIAPPDGGFLNYRFVNDENYANDYYGAIDEPGVDRSTLDAWKHVNGFDSGDDASAIYFNNGDLGFGRSMHMKRRVVGGKTHLAYYVSNFPNVEAARLGRNLIATVAMEYSTGPQGGEPFTKFYVFNGSNQRVNKADLDGRGDKFIPALCVICHGGSTRQPIAVNKGNLGAGFIAFDLESFLYSGFDSSFSRASQEPQFKLLNQGILETGPSAANKQLIEGWYGGSGLPNPTVDDRFFPPDPGIGWGGHEELYSVVVKTSCRSCHVNRDAPIDWASFDGFQLYGDFGLIEPLVCGPKGRMPNAKQTYVNFWASSNPHRPTVLRNSGVFPSTDPCPRLSP